MKKKHIIFILVFTFLLFLYFLFKAYFFPRLPVYEGRITVNGLVDTVEVFTDNFGVPHVFSKNDQDLFFSAGYIAASERLFQMSMVVFAVRGELSSVLGEEYLSTDIYLRTWGIPSMAKRLANILDPEEREVLESFCNGINQQIKDSKKNLPVEFKILGVSPPLWNPSDVTGYSRMMAHEMQGSWKAEVVYGAIAEYFGKEKLKEIYPDSLGDFPTVSEGLKSVFDSVLINENLIRNLLGFKSPHFGSNSWVLSGQKTKNKKPILANDPHLEFTQPARWYEMHLKGGSYNTSGVCIAGIPLPVIGNNNTCAWGFTNSMVDDLDFFIETINKEDPNKYLHNNEWKSIKRITETISIKNKKDTTIVIKKTHHGPIISDIHPILKDEDNVVSFSWVGHEETKEMKAFLGLNKMKSWEDFSKAVKNFSVPGQNIIYADTMGNIGWRPAVYIPIRKEGKSLIPRIGKDPTYDWKGYVPYNEMPFLFNPEKEYIFTANNKTIDGDFPYYISGLWADPSRAQRIEELIIPIKEGTIQDMKKIQTDLVSPFAKDILPYLFKYDINKEEKETVKYFNLLKEWNGNEEENSIEALIFHSIVLSLAKNIYGDELSLLGKNYLDSFLGLKYLYTRNLRKTLREGTSSWFDNIETRNIVENNHTIIRKSIIDGIKYVIKKYGDKKENLQWGKAHSLTHNHLLGKIKTLNKIFKFNVGPFKSGGSDKTIRAGGFNYSDPFKQTAGASMRRIVDLSNLEEIDMILPTGQSGHPHSPHYSDQTELYNRGQYKKTVLDEEKIRNSNYKKLILIPEK